MLNFTATELAAVTGGHWWNEISPSRPIEKVVSDSRADCTSGLFAAIAGERFDGHNFLAAARERNATAWLIDETRLDAIPRQGDALPTLVVPDVTTAFGAIGAAHRRKFPELKLAVVTGSVGKTSVKEMLRAIFTEVCGPEHVLATEGNTNNHLGVPQNLQRLNADIRYAVIECGTSAPGEIAYLGKLVAPSSVAVVNSIAPCHLEKLGSLDGVAAEKGSIFASLGVDGTAVLPEECAGRAILKQSAQGHKILSFGRDVKGELSSGTLDGSIGTLTFPDGILRQLAWELTGKHQFVNASAAACAALALGIAPEKIVRGLAATCLPGMRMKRTGFNGAVLLNDAYNANPASMRSVLEWLSSFPERGNFVLVLGDMLELGERQEQYHREILELARTLLPEAKLLAIGPRMTSQAPSSVECFPDAASAAARVKELAMPGKVLVFKGSRGLKLEEAMPK
ncbi:MAG: UDP-N-acetylmuramoyl-tripeptide--D-alanyl-D-alanine ligase [Victivallaceae bacterium]|nr:UDP-N-acetylmuramoyl-tripeptide--D-alanyl-D-alanine ligase [Victivallaceae bacterium]